MTDKIKNINRQIAKGSAWMVLFKLLHKSISIISTIILARLLSPEDFGLVAIAMMVVAFLDIFRAFGFDMVLIQNQKSTKDHYNTAWTFKILATSIIAAIMLLLSPFVASFYNDDRLLSIMPLLAIGVFISGFENIGVVAFRKELKFHKDFSYMLIRKVISFIVVVILAFQLRNYWALIGAFIATNIGVVIISYIMHPYRPGLCLAKAKELISFSAWLFINNFLEFLIQKAPTVVIGKISGAVPLGIFTLSREIAITTSAEIVSPINRAAFPGYSKLSSDLSALKDSVLNTLGMIVILILPASSGFAAIVPIMVPTLLGEKWIDTIPVMQILAFAGLFNALANFNSVYLALGKPKIITKIMMMRAIIFVSSLIYATYNFGIIGAAWSLLITGIVMLPFAYFPAITLLRISPSEILNRFARPLVASGIMFFSIKYIYFTYTANQATNNNLMMLLAIIAIGLLIYVSTILLLWKLSGTPKGSEQQILEELYSKLKIRK